MQLFNEANLVTATKTNMINKMHFGYATPTITAVGIRQEVISRLHSFAENSVALKV